jgi:phage-related protein
MNWTIHYYSDDLQQQLLKLPATLQARYFHLTDLMQEIGPDLGMPHTRAMGQGLFEIRLKGREGIARVFYCTVVNKRIVMLHQFIKKTDKTPLKELTIARQRLKDIKGASA